MVADIVKPANRKQTKTVNASATTTQYVYPDAGKDLTKVTVNGLTASAALGNATTDDVAEGKTFSSSNGILLTGTGAIIPNAHVYGAEWAGTSDPSWTRTDESANFSDPNPYYSGMSTTPSSPFDGLMPWAGMRRVSDTNAGELVEIPKFWYKWTRDGAKMKLQIADNYKPGFYTSPAHADRGDGVGERDYVYVGRYHCASDYLSKTNVLPKVSTTRATFRSGIHSLGSNIWQNDYAMYWTIRMLYLVEFANWDTQAVIGMGCGNGSSIQNTGASDSMSYHTGTVSFRNSYSVGLQYRYIEDLWADVYDFVDGIYFSNNNAYVINKPSSFSDTENGILIGTTASSDGYIVGYTECSISGYEYAIVPNVTSSQIYGYIRDYFHSYTYGQVLMVGAHYQQFESRGLFFYHKMMTASNIDNVAGSRLMVLPSSRIS